MDWTERKKRLGKVPSKAGYYILKEVKPQTKYLKREGRKWGGKRRSSLSKKILLGRKGA